jgi:D-3-phosphoglycerate dehydrogenase
MDSYKVVVINPGYESYRFECEILEPAGAELIIAAEDCITEELVISSAYNADAILVREGPITRSVIDSLEHCKIIARYGIGTDNVDLEAAGQRKIYVSIVPDYGTEDVSDHAIALLLSCIRTLPIRDKNVRKGIFETDINAEIYRTTGKNLGIIGYGKIASAFHRKWKGFLPSKVLVYDPLVDLDVIQKNGAKSVDLDTLLSDSDYISIHAPLTPETQHLFNEITLKKMKPTSILVNTSRGAIIDTIALANAIKKGVVLAAGLDVFENEPISIDHPLLSLSSVVLTPHMAWYSKESTKDLQKGAAKEVGRVLSGKLPQNWANPW